ncbi:MAG: DUF2452 domain-containing protein [Nitrospiraceae bacterium]|nr:MAG: DUF2452 domain-containing protein [Nitrospiraceae bacterium]
MKTGVLIHSSMNPNPQGKGIIPVLNDVASSRPQTAVPPKKIDQIAGELFTSMFVLESEFAFKPVIGREYYLYRKDSRFRLTLVSPEQWPGELFGRFIGRCMLERDITWTLEMDEQASMDQQLNRLIQEKKRAFEHALETAGQLGDVLPVYCASLPYYQRLFASALAGSLGISMQLSGIKDLTYSEAKGLLEDHT